MTTPPETDWLMPPTTDATSSDEQTAERSGPTTTARAAALLLAGLVVGGGAAFTFSHHSTTATPTAASAVAPQNGMAAPNGTLPPNGMAPQNGTVPPSGAGPAGVSGEQRLQGTVTAVGADSISVRTSSGTATYRVTSATQIVRNGSPATLSQLSSGDQVFLHVYPSGSSMVVERIFAGT